MSTQQHVDEVNHYHSPEFFHNNDIVNLFNLKELLEYLHLKEIGDQLANADLCFQDGNDFDNIDDHNNSSQQQQQCIAINNQSLKFVNNNSWDACSQFSYFSNQQTEEDANEHHRTMINAQGLSMAPNDLRSYQMLILSSKLRMMQKMAQSIQQEQQNQDKQNGGSNNNRNSIYKIEISLRNFHLRLCDTIFDGKKYKVPIEPYYNEKAVRIAPEYYAPEERSDCVLEVLQHLKFNHTYSDKSFTFKYKYIDHQEPIENVKFHHNAQALIFSLGVVFFCSIFNLSCSPFMTAKNMSHFYLKQDIARSQTHAAGRPQSSALVVATPASPMAAQSKNISPFQTDGSPLQQDEPYNSPQQQNCNDTDLIDLQLDLYTQYPLVENFMLYYLFCYKQDMPFSQVYRSYHHIKIHQLLKFTSFTKGDVSKQINESNITPLLAMVDKMLHPDPSQRPKIAQVAEFFEKF